ncbi:protein mono-ADP-ribosyltransferase PARP9 isoform 1-T2 [Menidia menidia]
MQSKLDIPLQRSSLPIVKKYAQPLSDILHTKFDCVATFHGVDFEQDRGIVKHRGPAAAPEKRVSVTLRGGVEVSVWKADLTNFQVDAVVNAANSGLQHHGGLAQALSAAGGLTVQTESDYYVKKFGPLQTGEAVVLDAGNLPCKKIIHVVGPELSQNPSKSEVSYAEPLLKKAICSILDRVKECKLSTVAIPAISSGLFHFPLPLCAKTIVSTVRSFYENISHKYLPKEIFLVNNDEPTVKEIEKAFYHIMAPDRPRPFSPTMALTTTAVPRSSSPIIRMGNVHVTLKKDSIEEQETDVIVNTASAESNLNIGEISRAILKKAGYGMQNEIKRAQKMGYVVPTKAYKLNCKEVYHTFCVDRTQQNAHKILFDSLRECLDRAAASHYKSIAFPAIGTGNLGFFKAEVAKMMLDAVLDFSQYHQSSMTVHIIIFPSDHQTFQAFEKEIRSYQPNISSLSLAPAAAVDRMDTSRTSAPHISLLSQSGESAAEAERWLTGLFTSTHFDICNNLILHFGEKEHQQLARLTQTGVAIEEFFTQGHACITIKGHSQEEAANAVLQVEAMLCSIQKELISEREKEMSVLLDTKVSSERLTLNHSSLEFYDQKPAFQRAQLSILKVEKVQNLALEMLFKLKKQQLQCLSSQTMFQRVPAQFCEMISRIGFQKECAPPEEPAYGEGIYFTSTVKKARELWRLKNEEYLYFVQAEVLKGKSSPGQRGLILPPPVGSDPGIIHDSVTGGHDISVIFSGYQALPTYIITCKSV